MRVIARDRQRGKTTDLLQIAVDEGYVFVCHDYREKERLQRLCRDANTEPPEIWTFSLFISGAWRMGTKELPKGIVIDNVDYMLQQLAGSTEVKAVAINQDSEDQG